MCSVFLNDLFHFCYGFVSFNEIHQTKVNEIDKKSEMKMGNMKTRFQMYYNGYFNPNIYS
ncbi:MAG: hypothetical protein V9E90_15315 [Saprospiraceae bacterium]